MSYATRIYRQYITGYINIAKGKRNQRRAGAGKSAVRGELVPCWQARTGATQAMQNMKVHVLSVSTVVTAGTRPEAMSIQVLGVLAVVVPNFVTAVVTAGRVEMIPRTMAT